MEDRPNDCQEFGASGRALLNLIVMQYGGPPKQLSRFWGIGQSTVKYHSHAIRRTSQAIVKVSGHREEHCRIFIVMQYGGPPKQLSRFLGHREERC